MYSPPFAAIAMSFSDVSFGGGASRAFESSGRRDADGGGGADLAGLTPFEKNFYVESPSVAAMTEDDVEAYRRKREITVEGKDVPKPVRDFRDVGFPGTFSLGSFIEFLLVC